MTKARKIEVLAEWRRNKDIMKECQSVLDDLEGDMLEIENDCVENKDGKGFIGFFGNWVLKWYQKEKVEIYKRDLDRIAKELPEVYKILEDGGYISRTTYIDKRVSTKE